MAALLCPYALAHARAPGAPLTPATREIVTHARLPAVCPGPWQGPRSSALPASGHSPGFHGCNDRAHLKCHMSPSAQFFRVFRARSFTQGCHWLAVLPGKDGTAALDFCWRAARMDCFQPRWPQEVPRRRPCLPFGHTLARGGRAGGNSDSSGPDEGISRGELPPLVASTVLTFLQAHGTQHPPRRSTPAT